MENKLIVLPEEVSKIAENVSAEKRNEVQSVLNHVFNGVSKMREQLDSVIVADHNDKVNMKLANTIRLGVRQVRLEAEKTFDAKRSEVQAQMLSYKTEDQLWLKAKQTMQILTKEIEENARWKEETRERFEAEQKELKVQQRMLKVAKVAPEMGRSEFENMSDESFELFFAGIEKAYNDKIEAERKAEEERIEKEKAEAKKNERLNKMFTLGLKWDGEQFTFKDINFHFTDLICLSDDDFEKAFEGAKKRKEQIELDEKKENERLKAEAEAAEKQLAQERAKAEAERKAIEEVAKKEREEARKLAAEIEAKKQAEEKARKEAEAAEKKAQNAPDVEKIRKLISDIKSIYIPNVKNEKASEIVKNIELLLSKVVNFGNNEINKI